MSVYHQIAFILVAIFVLFVCWIFAEKTEDGLKDNYETYIDREMQSYCDYDCDEKGACPANTSEVSLDKPIQLDSKTQLVIFGVNHQKTMGCGWTTYLLDAEGDRHELEFQKCGRFWKAVVVAVPQDGAICLRGDFKVMHKVLTARPTQTIKAYLVPRHV